MAPHYADGDVTLYHGDCLDVMRQLPAESIDAIVTDPPYGLGFMGKAWDDLPPGREWAEECLRVLKPGGHLLAFGGSRTWHRLAVAVEEAGFEIRDSIAWLYGSGFPKSLDVSKAITGAQMGHGSNSGAIRRATMGEDYTESGRRGNRDGVGRRDTGMAGRGLALTDDAKAWQGWGTALKPAFEPIVVGRKPLVGTVAANVLAHGTGALNIDACRVASIDAQAGRIRHGGGIVGAGSSYELPDSNGEMPAGRWPANVVLDDSQAVALDKQSGTLHTQNPLTRNGGQKPGWSPAGTERPTIDKANPNGGPNEAGSGASRFFPTFRYEAKAPTAERPRDGAVAHPTVKPLDLMRWLVRLVTPPGGLVLEPFAGSGTTAEACILEGFRCIAVEREAAYLPLILARITKELEPSLGLDFGGG